MYVRECVCECNKEKLGASEIVGRLCPPALGNRPGPGDITRQE